MNGDTASQTHNQQQPEENPVSFMEREISFGIGRFADRTSAAGTRDFVENALNIESRTLIRQAVFVVTFVPIAVTLIAKLPDIILAIAALR